MTDTVDHVDEDPAPGRRSRGSTFASLSEPRFRRLWAGSLLAFLAVQMQLIARGWLALELTGSNKGLGIVYLGFGIPMLVLSPLGGVVADRLSKRRVLMACQGTLALSTGLVALALTLDLLAFWMLVASAAIQASTFSFMGPARMAFAGELVGPRRLANAIVLQQMSMNSTKVLGPAVAGVLIGLSFAGPVAVYYVTTALSLGAIVVTASLPAGHPRTTGPRLSLRAEMVEGVRYATSRPPLRLLIGVAFVVVIFGFPFQAFLPTLADETFDLGPGSYGLMTGATAIGAVAASLWIAGRANGPALRTMQLVAGVGFGLGVILVGTAPTFPLALAALVMLGAASSAFESLNSALVLGVSDPAYHGRLQSLMNVSFSFFGMVALPLGALADSIGIRTTYALMGLVVLSAMAVYSLRSQRLIRLTAPVMA